MSVAFVTRIRPAFDRSVVWNRVRTRIAFIGVFKRERRATLSVAAHDNERNSDRRTRSWRPDPRTKVRMQRTIRADATDILRGSGVDRRLVDANVPDIVGRKHGATRDARTASGRLIGLIFRRRPGRTNRHRRGRSFRAVVPGGRLRSRTADAGRQTRRNQNQQDHAKGISFHFNCYIRPLDRSTFQ